MSMGYRFFLLVTPLKIKKLKNFTKLYIKSEVTDNGVSRA
jgi:hypothetical protein